MAKMLPQAPVVKNQSFSTRSISVGQHADREFGSVAPPIHMTSTYKQTEPGKPVSDFDYTRAGNPTVDRLQRNIAALESGKHGLVFASGCGAFTAILGSMQTGDHILTVDDVYGGTNRLMNRVFNHLGLKNHMIEMTDLANVERHITPKTKYILVETPTNPLLKIFDIQAICKLAKQANVPVIVDNTFASAYLQSPLLLGADVVLHSCTKYMGGHSDVIGGALVTNDDELHEKFKFNLKSMGACMSPFDAWILLRSVKTLKPRMDLHCSNAFVIAHFLQQHPKVQRVYYPGLESHPNHAVAKKQMRSFGGMISVDLKGSAEQAYRFTHSLKHFTLAESLGGVESLISVPALMTHASVPPEVRVKLGISDSLIRISVGLEDLEDLLLDLNTALDEL